MKIIDIILIVYAILIFGSYTLHLLNNHLTNKSNRDYSSNGLLKRMFKADEGNIVS